MTQYLFTTMHAYSRDASDLARLFFLLFFSQEKRSFIVHKHVTARCLPWAVNLGHAPELQVLLLFMGRRSLLVQCLCVKMQTGEQKKLCHLLGEARTMLRAAQFAVIFLHAGDKLFQAVAVQLIVAKPHCKCNFKGVHK